MSVSVSKKILFALTVAIVALFATDVVLAATDLPRPTAIGLPFEGQSSTTSIGKIIKQAILFAGVLAVMALTYAGILMMLSYGDESKVKGAKNIIQYALIGIVLSGASYAIIEAINALSLK